MFLYSQLKYSSLYFSINASRSSVIYLYSNTWLLFERFHGSSSDNTAEWALRKKMNFSFYENTSIRAFYGFLRNQHIQLANIICRFKEIKVSKKDFAPR